MFNGCTWDFRSYTQSIWEFAYVVRRSKILHISCHVAKLRMRCHPQTQRCSQHFRWGLQKCCRLGKCRNPPVASDKRNRVDVETHLEWLHLHIDIKIAHPSSKSYIYISGNETTKGSRKSRRLKEKKTSKRFRKDCGSLCHVYCRTMWERSTQGAYI